MKKRVLLLFLLLLALTSLAGPVSATPVDDLTQLADYFPDDTAIFAAMRTDDAFITELDNLLAALIAVLPPDTLPDTSLRGLLNLTAFGMFGGNFDTAVRPWLGNSAAIGLFDIEALLMMGSGVAFSMDELMEPASQEIPLVAAVEITDRAGAEQALGSMGMDFVVIDFDDFTLLALPDGSAVLVADDVLLLGTLDTVVAFYEDVDVALSENEDFQDALDALPASSYNAVVYVDALGLVEGFAPEVLDFTLPGFPALDELLGSVALGLTILDGRTLALDLALVGPDMDTLRGIPGYVDATPVDLNFAGNIPAGAQLVIHDNGLGPEFNAVLDMVSAIGPILSEFDAMGMLEDMGGMGDLPVDIDLSSINLGGVSRTALTVIFAGFTGLNLQNDVLSWMTGDYATFARLLPLDSEMGFTVDAGVVIAATDPEAAAAVVSGIQYAAGQYDLDNRIEAIGGGEALVLTAPIRAFFPEDFPRDVLQSTPALDLLIGANDSVFAVGSRPAVSFALDGSGGSLLDDPVFQYAQTLFLEDTALVWYIGLPSLLEALPALAPVTSLYNLYDFVAVARAIESATITARVNDSGATVARLTLTLEDEPVSLAPFEPSMPDGSDG